MSSLLSALLPAILGGLSAVLLRWFAAHLNRAAPIKLDGDSGTIRPDRWSGWIVTLLGVLMMLGSITLVLLTPVGLFGWIGFALGALLAGCMFPSVTSVHALNWSKEGVEGPANMVLGTLGLRRTMISWSDIVRSGTSPTMYWFLESHDGRRVYWSYLYPGHGEFAAAIQRNRPDIPVPGNPLAFA